jgi:NAD(P)-dependent dehydrogenase (short-subunit alcohol dehydrogenase family)
MDLGLRGKVAVVSGSSDGIGYAVAHSLAQEGARIVLCARREPLLAEARKTIEKETGAEVLAVTCDVQRLDEVQRLVAEVMQRFGVINIWSTTQEAFRVSALPISTMLSGIRC